VLSEVKEALGSAGGDPAKDVLLYELQVEAKAGGGR